MKLILEERGSACLPGGSLKVREISLSDKAGRELKAAADDAKKRLRR